jgi:hypothetical protein
MNDRSLKCISVRIPMVDQTSCRISFLGQERLYSELIKRWAVFRFSVKRLNECLGANPGS